jgi:16S rRNA (adenine1518-N6/adenine1519-N6)-dimethyltransferase
MDAVPKKRFGQHFLTDRGVLHRLVELIAPTGSDLFLEVGAGTGALTTRLASPCGRIIAIEVDRDVIPALRQALSPFPTAAVLNEDILNLDLEELVRGFPANLRVRIAGNLPYNIGTAVIEKFLYSGLPVHDMTFMLQEEVAERIVSGPGSRRYGVLSVECQHAADVRIAFRVSPGAFTPRPGVMSAVVVFRPRGALADAVFESSFLMVTKAAFAHRRKTIANSLRRHPQLGHCSEQILSKAGIKETLRAEQVSVREYETLARRVADCGLPPADPEDR